MATAKKRRKKKQTKSIVLVVISILLILASLGVVLLIAWKAFFKQQRYFQDGEDVSQDTSLFANEEHSEKSKTFLLCGLDESESLTDVMMLVNFDIEKNELHILHIPRDSFVGLDMTSTGKMNAIYSSNAYDEIDGITNIGRLIKAVNNQFQIGIDYYATITLSAFRDVVDLTGGIPINMLWTINYDQNITIYPGEQVLNGEQAEAMIRYRKGYASADIGRMEARSYFLAAAFSHFKDIGTIDTIKIIESFLTDNKGEFTTNMSLGEIKDYVTLLGRLTSDKVFVHTVPTESVPTSDPANPTRNWTHPQDLLTMHTNETAEILNEYFRPYTDDVPYYELELVELKNSGEGYSEDVVSFEDINNGDASKPREH